MSGVVHRGELGLLELDEPDGLRAVAGSQVEEVHPNGDGEVELPPPSEPMAVARRLVADRFLDDGWLTLRRWRGGWWRWESSHWVELDDSVVRAAAYDFTEHAVFVDTSGRTPRERPWAPSRYRVADLLDALGAVTGLGAQVQPPSWLAPVDDAPPADELVAARNGLLHVATRRLFPHDPRLFNTVAVPFDFAPDAAPPTRWLAFLDELWPDDPDSVATLQEFAGYAIAGRTDLHKILLLVGPTRAGKGVIARVLKSLVGAGNCAGPTLASLGTNFGLQPLIGKSLAIVSDARLGGANVHQVVERLLSVSGEDMLTVDRKYREPWSGTLPTRFVVLTNELPRFGDASGAIAARFVVLTLARSWLGRENPRLTAELLEELPGILNWSLDGLARLAETGTFTEPEASRDAVVALADLVSPVAAFVRDRCERAGEVACADLYAAWRAWAEENGHRAGSAQTFGRDLRAVVPGLRVARPRGDGDRTRRYVGVRLTQIHNGADRGPSGTAAPVRSGPKDLPLSPQVEHADPDAWLQSALAAIPADAPDRGMRIAEARAEHVRRRREAAR
jgi:putative DNA primase/helicase